MDPIQAIAARQVSRARKSTSEEIDGFYDDNAFDALHAARRVLGRFARLVRAMPDRPRGAVRQSPEIASAPRRA